ncbi:MAG: ribbon-helix-helix domain-containing protein [Ignavibacteriaceae bacterium]
MATTKIAISIDKRLLDRVDKLVQKNFFANRSKAFQTAVEEKILRMEKSRLAQECAKLNTAEEKSLSEIN